MKQLLQNLPIKIKIGLIILLPLCGYLITSGLNLASTYAGLRSAKDIISMSEFSGQISLLVHELQKKRGSSSDFLASKGQKFADTLDTQRASTDKIIHDYKKALTTLQSQPAEQS